MERLADYTCHCTADRIAEDADIHYAFCPDRRQAMRDGRLVVFGLRKKADGTLSKAPARFIDGKMTACELDGTPTP